jgi:hypothetical protein
MKNAVVVVDGKERFFRGYESLIIINKGEQPMPIKAMETSHGFGFAGTDALLIVKATINNKEQVIAVFKKWDYWESLDSPDNTNSPMEINESLKYVLLVCQAPEGKKDAVEYDENQDVFTIHLRGGYTTKMSSMFINTLKMLRDQKLLSHHKKICQHCGKPFIGRGRFCSTVCSEDNKVEMG